MKLKVCGVTNVEDAVMARALGAEMVGVIGIKGASRFIGAEELKKIRLYIRDGLVYVTDSLNAAEEMLSFADVVQVHRTMNESEMDRLEGRVKVIAYVPATEYGSRYIISVREHGFIPLIHAQNGKLNLNDLSYFGSISDSGIAGGIGVDNVHQFLYSGAMFVDSSSGTEESLGRKSPWKIRRMVGMLK